ncbi:MAG TPA: tRNA pseudouridine(55) synthase TruB [Bacillota bacterium]|nr:tRNA pseudouridine(55) synthase TruB [Bacillota bacterium]
MDTDINGIINLRKSAKYTSHDCVAVIRKLFGVKKAGHTGTLDPMAEGVLPVCLGKATRIIEYMDNDLKEYRCTMKLGVETDTQDVWGSILCEYPLKDITERSIRDAVLSFRGITDQIPPKYSALKVKGKRLYKYAREGLEVEIKPRSINIEDIIIDDIMIEADEEGKVEKAEVIFTVNCCKGTYIRTLCHDIGRKLGCGAAMSGLTRTVNGIFCIEDAVSLQELESMSEMERIGKLLPMDHSLSGLEVIWLDDKRAGDFVNGREIRDFTATQNIEDKSKMENSKKRFRVYSGNTFLGIAGIEGNELRPEKVLCTKI